MLIAIVVQGATGVSSNKVSCVLLVHNIQSIIFSNFPNAMKHEAMHSSTYGLMCMMPKVAKPVVLICPEELISVSDLMADLLSCGDYKCRL